MNQVETGAHQSERQEGLLAEAIRGGVDRHEARRGADHGSHEGRVPCAGHDHQAAAQDRCQPGEQAANIATNAQRPDQARIEPDALHGRPALSGDDP